MLAFYLVLVLGSVAFIDGKLPDYIVPCSASSPLLNDCAKEHGLKAIPHLLKGDKKHHLPPLVPLNFDKIEIKPSNTFELILTKLKVFGLDKVELRDMSFNPVKKHVECNIFASEIKLLSDYKVSGKILVLPISGEGKADIQFKGGNFHYTMDYDVIKRDGVGYGTITKSDIKFIVDDAKFQLDNLFGGNKELGDNMNKVLNENAQDVIKDLAGAISEAIKTVVNGIVASFSDSTPLDEILLP